MTKTLKLTVAGLALLLLIATTGFAAIWTLLNSESGTAFLAGQLRQTMGDTLSWETLEGPITGPLQLTGVSISQPGTDIKMDKVRLDWQPGALLQGSLALSLLALDNMTVTLTTEESSPGSTSFSPSSLNLPVDISLSDVRLTNVRITQDTGSKVLIDSLQGNAELKGSQLTIKQLEVQASQGSVSISGTTSLENDMPLDARVELTLTGQEGTPLKAELGLGGIIGWGDAIDFALAYDLGVQGLAQLEAGLPDADFIAGKITGRFLGDAIELKQFSLEAENHTIALALQGAVSGLNSDAPSLDTQLQWQGLHWPLDTDAPDLTSAAGALQFKGPLNDYQLEFEASIAGTDIPAGQWQGQGSGNLQQLKLDAVNARILDGELAATGLVSWDPVPAWQLRIEGAELNPSFINPELEGVIAAALDTSGKLDPELGLLVRFDIERLSGELFGYPLDVSAAGELIEDSIELARLDLSSGQNRFEAEGELSANALDLSWELRALSPGEFVAGVAGTLTGTGTITGSTEAPRVNARLKGRSLAMDSFSTTGVDITLVAGTAPGDALTLAIATDALLSDGDIVADSLSLKADGSNGRHQLQLAIVAAEQSIDGRLQGGITAALDGWQGSIEVLNATTTALGAWSLANPTPLSIGIETASLGDSCLIRQNGPGRLCAQGSWRSNDDSALALELKQIPLELLQTTATGDVGGNVQASLAADGSLQAAGKLEVSPGFINLELENGNKQMAHEGGALTLKVDAQGAEAELHFIPPENGTLDANLKLPALTRIPFSDPQALSGSLQITLPDLSSIAAWVPDIQSATGRMNADVSFAGTLDQPRFTGTLELQDGSADIPVAGLQLRQAELQISSKPAQPDLLQVSGGVKSGSGEISLSGIINTAETSAALRLQGNYFEAFNTRDAQVSLSPNLKIDWEQETLQLRGDLLIPEAKITPKLELSPAMLSQDGEEVTTPDQIIAPSADVVVVNGNLDNRAGEELSAPFRIDSQTRLILGDAVNVKAMGFVGRITGNALFTNTPEQTSLIPIANGQISVEDGTFRSFGQDLDIRTGQLLFNNVPATEPVINLRAVRWIDGDAQVSSAGIILTGPIATPTMELFSRPQLEASEVQAYLLTGRSSGDRNNVLSIGTYLSPRIYVGYGYNTLENTSEFNSIFNITPRYGAGIDVGEADNNLNMTFTYER